MVVRQSCATIGVEVLNSIRRCKIFRFVRGAPNVVIFLLMASVSLRQVTEYCDRILCTNSIQDYDGAVNGLQVENRGAIVRIAAAVDASVTTIQMAIAAKANLLVVHHGLFWSK